jgi:hypothetical protein
MASLPNRGNIPTVFALLPNKTTQTYTQLLRTVKNLSDDIFTGKI